MKSLNCLAASVMAGLVVVGPAKALDIYQDDFSGTGANGLDGTTPDISTTGESWVAAPTFLDDGSSVTGGAGASATLAFSPVDGLVYTATASLDNVTGDNDWFALGFANGQSSANSTNSRFITGTVEGLAWAMYRGTQNPGNTNQVFFGDTSVEPNSGITSGVAWLTNPTAAGGSVTLRLTLDTTGGAGAWTVLAEADTGGGFQTIRAVETLLDETITSVGVVNSNANDITGTITSFTLSDNTTAGPTADLSGDGDVDDEDLGLFFSAFTGPDNGPSLNPAADLSGDGDVDDEDLGEAFSQFTGPLGPPSVPEPASLALLLGLGGIVASRRR